jgi:hypothetical protein
LLGLGLVKTSETLVMDFAENDEKTAENVRKPLRRNSARKNSRKQLLARAVASSHHICFDEANNEVIVKWRFD